MEGKDIALTPLIIDLIKLTKAAIQQAEEKGVEPEMLNAIRENIRLILNFCDELRC